MKTLIRRSIQFYKKNNLQYILIRILYKILVLISGIFLSPISIICFINNFRILKIDTARIGHFSIEPDIILKGERLGFLKKRKYIILIQDNKNTNQHLKNYWKQYFTIIDNKFIVFLFNGISIFKYINFDTKFIINADENSQYAYLINKSWGQRPPTLTISNTDEQWGQNLLKSLGLKDGQWFVCMHARDPYYSKFDEKIQSYRNSSINNLSLSVQEIKSRGGIAIRVGTSSREIPIIDGLIDYPNGIYKSDRADLYLLAKARFIVGNTSGIALLGSVFGTPCALANMIPMSVMGIGINDITIPKLLMENKRVLSFNEVMNSDIANYRYTSNYNDNLIIPIENDEEDIFQLTLEMLEKLDGCIHDEEGKNMQEKFKMLLKPNHYGFGASSNISLNFLKKYINLLVKNGTN